MSAHFTDSTTRFTTKAEVYAKARPRYPQSVVAFLESQNILHPGNTVVDLGSGTGLSALPFLETGYTVICVEPNDSMRAEGVHFLAQYPRFRTVQGSSVATSLPDRTAEVVIAAQAFHWFDLEKTRAEMQRLLQPPGWFVAMWNHRNVKASAFQQQYDTILRRYCPDYHILAELYGSPTRAATFFSHGYRQATLPNPQQLNWELFYARIESSSYIPKPEHQDFAPFMGEMKQLFDQHAREGVVQFDLEVWLQWGKLL